MARKGDGKARSDRRRAPLRLTKRVTKDELEKFGNRANEAGFSNAQDYLGAFVGGHIQIEAATRKDIIRLLGELGKIGSNINQIARAVNQDRITNLDVEAVRDLAETQTQITALRREIREVLR